MYKSETIGGVVDTKRLDTVILKHGARAEHFYHHYEPKQTSTDRIKELSQHHLILLISKLHLFNKDYEHYIQGILFWFIHYIGNV